MEEADKTMQFRQRRIRRIKKLKEHFLEYKPEICSERARIITRSYTENESFIAPIKRAKAFYDILSNMSIYIDEDELIVGNLGYKPRTAPIYPEYSVNWILEQIDTFSTRPGDKFFITEENKKILLDILPLWKGKTVEERALSRTPGEIKKSMDSMVFISQNMLTGGVGHYIIDYWKVLNQGIKGIKEEINKNIEELDLSDYKSIDKKTCYDAMLITCEAIILFARRFADRAAEMSEAEENVQRKRELKTIAEICRTVPENPANSFHEALQAFWFIEAALYLEQNGLAVSPGRFDQYMLPFYKKDLDEGILDREEAQELLECLWIKLPNVIKLYNNDAAKAFGGFPTNQCIIIGGQDKYGFDATNELSYACLDATANTMLNDPSLAVRLHKNTPLEFIKRASEVIRMGSGMPKIFNDEAIIPSMLNKGIDLEDARDYAIVGCVEPVVPGKNLCWSNAAYFSLAKCLELAINDGKSLMTGEQLGLKTGKMVNFESFDDVVDSYKKQVEYFVRQMTISINIIDMAQGELTPNPFTSLFMSDCIGKGEDLIRGGAVFNFTGPQGVGVANVADSLSAVKKIVFEDEMIGKAELTKLLETDFEGNERLRQLLMNRPPKYGNDEDYVDLLARKIALIYCDEVKKYKNVRGGFFQPGLYPVSSHVALGEVVGAMPDGRKSGEPLADGVSPVQGKDLKGPTSVMRSVCKLDHVSASNGTLLNVKLHPNAIKDERGLLKFVDLNRSFIDMGGWHVQYNIINVETLLEAQKSPEKYRSLLVRVAGYSAFFVELDKKLQDDIIKRTEHVI